MSNHSYSEELGATGLIQRSGSPEILSLLRDRRFWLGAGVWTLLLFILINPLVAALKNNLQDNVGVGQGQLAEDPTKSTRPVRYDWSIGDRYEQFLRYVPDSRKTNLVVISGMSQMYTINDYRPGDQTIAEWMDDSLAPKGTRVFGLAAPNMSHQESVFVLLSTLTKPETKPDVYIFAIAFGQLREIDVRKSYLDHLRKHPELVAVWRSTAERYRTKYPLATAQMLITLDSLHQNDAVTNEDTFESRLRGQVSRVVPVVRERKTLSSGFRLGLFKVRNAILGIKASTKRPIIRQRYDANREFLALLADVGRENGVKVLLYVVPFNPMRENPYVPDEYASFKQWLDVFAKEQQIPLVNLENTVPSPDWGTFLGGPDFGHFRGAGHRKTAAALLESFSTQLAPASPMGDPKS
jgi:hypothetical protein